MLGTADCTAHVMNAIFQLHVGTSDHFVVELPYQFRHLTVALYMLPFFVCVEDVSQGLPCF